MKPVKPVSFNAEQQLLHKIWLKANREGEWSHTFQDEGKAQRFRFALYNSVKPVRDGRVIAPELLTALDDCIVRARGALVTISRRTNDLDLQEIAAELGEDLQVTSSKMADADEIEASMRRMQELLEASAPVSGVDRLYPMFGDKK